MVAAYCHKLFDLLIWFFNEFQIVLFFPVFLPYFSSFLRKKVNLDSLAFFNVAWKALRYKVFNRVHFALGVWESSFRFKSSSISLVSIKNWSHFFRQKWKVMAHEQRTTHLSFNFSVLLWICRIIMMLQYAAST